MFAKFSLVNENLLELGNDLCDKYRDVTFTSFLELMTRGGVFYPNGLANLCTSNT
jgi:hypothetical protein